jgi:hypothetical protein
MSALAAGPMALLRRYPYCAVCVIVTVLCAGTSWFLWSNVADLQAVLEDRSKEGKGMLETLVGGSTQRQELAAVRDVARRIDDNLVGEANLAENHWYFYKIEGDTNARISGGLHQLNSPITDNSPMFRRVPYTMKVTGTFEQVGAFLLALETGPRLAKITSFSFTRNGPAIALELNLEMLGKK